MCPLRTPFPGRSLIRWPLLALLVLVGDGCRQAALSSAETEECLAEAVRLMSYYDFDNARELLRKHLPRMETDTPAWMRGQYLWAIANWQSVPGSPDRIENAVQALQTILDRHPRDPLMPLALRALGRIAEIEDFPGDPRDRETARRYYERIRQEWPESVVADEATLWLAGLHWQVSDQPGELAKGLQVLLDYLQEHPENQFAALMQEKLGETYWKQLHDAERALFHFQAADRLGWTNRNTISLNLQRMGQLAEELARWEVAAGYYARIIKDYPRDASVWLCRQKIRQLAEAHPGLPIAIPADRGSVQGRSEGDD